MQRHAPFPREAYLASCSVVDHHHPAVRAEAQRLKSRDPVETARRCFERVRDGIAHSADHQRSPTTCSASEVLAHETGYCYAKSHLLAALLRANGLPAGLCYQRLTVDGPTPPHCLHGYVAVELPDMGFYAIDARGNKQGVLAEFDPPHERLAFRTEHAGERDFPLIFAEPLAVVVACLREHTTWDAVLANLPDATELEAPAQP